MTPENELSQSAILYRYASDAVSRGPCGHDKGLRAAKKRAKLKLQRSALRFALHWLEEWQKVVMHPPRKKSMQGGIDELKFVLESLKDL